MESFLTAGHKSSPGALSLTFLSRTQESRTVMKQSCESECFDNLPQLTGSVSGGNGAGGGQRGLTD